VTETPWIASYPSFVEPELAPLPSPHLPGFIRTAADTYAETVAFTQCMPNGMNGSLTYRQIDELSDAFATYLRESAGVQHGDRVAVQMPNCLSYPVVAFGVFKAGAVLVNTNPLYTPTEMIHQFSDSGAAVLVMIDMFADRLDAVLPHTSIKTVITTRIGEFFPPVIAASFDWCKKSGTGRCRKSLSRILLSARRLLRARKRQLQKGSSPTWKG